MDNGRFVVIFRFYSFVLKLKRHLFIKAALDIEIQQSFRYNIHNVIILRMIIYMVALKIRQEAIVIGQELI